MVITSYGCGKIWEVDLLITLIILVYPLCLKSHICSINAEEENVIVRPSPTTTKDLDPKNTFN